MISININPVIFSLAGREIRWYGVIVLFSIVIAYWFVRREFKRERIPLSFLSEFTFWSLVGGLIGARLFHILSMPGFYFSHPLKMLALYEGGISIQGAVIGGVIAGYITTRSRGLSFLYIADRAIPGVILGTALGRFACIINGDTWGSPTGMPWGFVYTHPNALVPMKGIPLHPTPLYEMLWGFFILSLLYPLRDKFQTPGIYFLIFIIFYFLGRFFIEFFRGDSHYILGFRVVHIISLITIFIAVSFILFLWKKKQSLYKEVNYG